MNEEVEVEVIESSDNNPEVIETGISEVESNSGLVNYSVDQILDKCNREEQLSSDIPYENVRNNSKIFLIYYAKSQLERVLKLSKYLEELEDRLIENSQYITDPELLMKVIGTIQGSLSTAINLIDKVSTNDNYVKFVFNDNRQVINNIQSTTLNAAGQVNLSRESRIKIRELAENLLTKVDKVIDEGGNVNGINQESDQSQ